MKSLSQEFWLKFLTLLPCYEKLLQTNHHRADGFHSASPRFHCLPRCCSLVRGEPDAAPMIRWGAGCAPKNHDCKKNLSTNVSLSASMLPSLSKNFRCEWLLSRRISHANDQQPIIEQCSSPMLTSKILCAINASRKRTSSLCA